MTQGRVYLLLCLFLLSCSGALQKKTVDPYADSIQHLKTQLMENPGDHKAVRQLGILFYRDNQYKNAITTLTEALAREGNQPQVLAYLGLSLEENGQLTEAINIYRRYEDLPPNNDYQLWLKGRYLLAERRRERLLLARDLTHFKSNLLGSWTEERVVIAPLQYHGNNTQYAGLGKVISEKICTELQSVSTLDFITVEKSYVFVSLAELPPFAGTVDPSARTLGQFFEAPIVLTGGYDVVDQNVVIDFSVWDLRNSEEPRKITRIGSIHDLRKIMRRMTIAVLEKSISSTSLPEAHDRLKDVPIPWEILTTFAMGVYLEDQHDYFKAIEQYQRVLEADPNNLDAQQRLRQSTLFALAIQDPIRLFNLDSLAKKRSP